MGLTVAAFALLVTATGCAETYQQPVQPTVQGRASLMAIPPSEPVPFTEPPPPVAYNAPQAAPPAQPQATNRAPTTQSRTAPQAGPGVGPLPALPSQAPRYEPPPPPPPKVVYRSYPVYYGDSYYYRPRTTFSVGVSSGPGYYGYRRWHHRPYVGWGVGWGWGY